MSFKSKIREFPGGSVVMETHSIILAYRIPWTEELGGVQSMNSQSIEHD